MYGYGCAARAPPGHWQVSTAGKLRQVNSARLRRISTKTGKLRQVNWRYSKVAIFWFYHDRRPSTPDASSSPYSRPRVCLA